MTFLAGSRQSLVETGEPESIEVMRFYQFGDATGTGNHEAGRTATAFQLIYYIS